jgi:flagellar basal body-associated protein FliL
MEETLSGLTNMYLQTGFMGMFFIVVMMLVIWYFTKGRKQVADEKEKLIREQARISAVIDNNTSVINNNTEVIKINTQTRLDEKECLKRMDDRMERHGDQHDEMLRNQTVLLDRQNRK